MYDLLDYPKDKLIDLLTGGNSPSLLKALTKVSSFVKDKDFNKHAASAASDIDILVQKIIDMDDAEFDKLLVALKKLVKNI